MINYKVYNQEAELVGAVDLADKIFNVKTNQALIHQAVVAQMANARKVIAHTKGRGEVRGGGKKPWKQKGTGRARHGSSRSPIWKGGGVTFGPTNERNFKKDINKKMKQKAIFMALSDKVANVKLIILDKLEASEYKTKVFNQILSNLETKIFVSEKKVLPEIEQPLIENNSELKPKTKAKRKSKVARSILVIISEKDEKLKYSAKNLVGAKLINLDNINLVDLLKYKHLVSTQEAIKKLVEKY
ncbi:50S ribosomal protein L4 [Patescibacteria group bacterium]|nr:50S ribosomal protein L4 [Patescibacteria group bacterium]MBU0879311.1 50S ribosomal protein L4 [Patescibacteria group bacterium]MBU0880245.1 50S ribosomal protein L4 [Patescibacteria group bacterium]MBU0897807.1 50S ribosomal protein L4 [Patescibacteria group bacterium]MBU1062654.1 50S ribosomal protein L4 [Patescibacteria group bacterium]